MTRKEALLAALEYVRQSESDPSSAFELISDLDGTELMTAFISVANALVIRLVQVTGKSDEEILVDLYDDIFLMVPE